MEIISSHKIRHIPIIEEDKLLGIVSIGDVVNHIMEQYKDENQKLRDFINQWKKISATIVFDNGFIKYVEKKSWHPNVDYIILFNIRRK